MSETLCYHGICAGGIHGRVWAGSLEAAPKTCDCGAMRYVQHTCSCGNVHETQVRNDPITREWDTPEEDKAWSNL